MKVVLYFVNGLSLNADLADDFLEIISRANSANQIWQIGDRYINFANITHVEISRDCCDTDFCEECKPELEQKEENE